MKNHRIVAKPRFRVVSLCLLLGALLLAAVMPSLPAFATPPKKGEAFVMEPAHLCRGKPQEASKPPTSVALSPQGGYTVWHTDVNHSYWWPDHYFDIEVDARPEDISDLSLTITAWDVDFTDPTGACEGGPEVDKVYINNHYLGILRGTNNSWSTNPLPVDPAWINGATDTSPSGTNTIYIDTDSAGTGCWCVGIGWAGA